MFELPRAKRVRREELQSPASSPRSSPDPEVTELLRSRINDDYEFIATLEDGDPTEHNAIAPAEASEDEVELILFAGQSTTQRSNKIRLASPEVNPQSAGFVLERPRNYYFAEEIDRKRHGPLQSVAVDGDAVMKMSRQPWPGSALPWKVRSISANGLKTVVRIGHPPTLVTVEEGEKTRKRKGKKARIALRKKLQASKSKQQQQAILAKEKAEADREKKTRRNREKKLKKKVREKAKKVATSGEGEGDGSGSEAEGAD
ncbi:hypothetical protein K491DRAFT_304222 [Lophiostoma macrostomum CBS 122681]|uniref:DUF2011 domain-containing protein n=1 Tax=Lophiostoma macrostomum CBS 122681 TaxID=1314788 RepID=A0A6A6SI11_9PLEO|nr:hypothetical protein K491DRAFT_304222 [Lophiostoma macrostomum CBS 122681]